MRGKVALRDGIDAGEARSVASFLPLHGSDLQVKPPRFSRPVQVGAFGMVASDATKRYVSGSDAGALLKGIAWEACKSSALPLNLAFGFDYEAAVRDEENDGGRLSTPLTPILRCLAEESSSGAFRSLLERVNFVTFRNNLNKIMNTVYNPSNEWTIGVHRPFDGSPTIFLGIQPGSRRSSNYRALRGAFCGRKFEQLMLAEPSSSFSEYCAVVKASLGNHRIIMSGEIDGKDVNTDEWVELKTTQEPANERSNDFFKRCKLSKWWVQSFLVGCPNIAIGYLDEGDLLRVERVKTLHLPKMSQDAFDYRRILTFADGVLTWIARTLATTTAPHQLRYFPAEKKMRLRPMPAASTRHVLSECDLKTVSDLLKVPSCRSSSSQERARKRQKR